MTDDQGYGDISCKGNPVLSTPNLDMFCNQGIHFTNFQVSPYSAPTRASLIVSRITPLIYELRARLIGL